MQSLYDKLRPNRPQYGLGALTEALQPFEQALRERRERKIREEDKKNQEQAFKAAGYSPDVAKALVNMEPQDRQYVLKGLAERGFGGGFSENTGLGSLFQQAPQGLDMLQGLAGSTEGYQNPFYQAGLQGNASNIEIPSLIQNNTGNEQEIGMRRPRSIQEALSLPTKKEQLENKKVALKEKQIANQDIRESYKQTAPYRTKTLEEAASARNVLDDLDRMKQLETGDAELDTPGYIEFLERSGFDIPALMNPGSEEFNKLRQTQLRDARQYFGGRVTNFEMDQFLKSIPSLNQSPEGRKRVIANMERINKLKEKQAEVMRKIIKENKGIPPLDLAEQVDERLAPERKKISEQFKEDLKRPVPKGQSKYITALQAAAGSFVGGVGSKIVPALKGAAQGAIVGAGIGKAGGPIGALGGAGLGALGGLSGLI